MNRIQIVVAKGWKDYPVVRDVLKQYLAVHGKDLVVISDNIYVDFCERRLQVSPL